jgi:hypothetical protein
VQPSSIILSLDKLIQKQFPISARTIGKVANGYYVKSLKMAPDVITIAGPHTILSQVDELFTKAINLEGMKQSVQLQVPLEMEPAIVELIGETSVTAEITIGLETVARTLDKMPVHVVIDGVKREVKPERVKVTANIPQNLLADNVDPKNLFTVTAIKQDGDDELKVKVIPRIDVEFPIEILSIIPDTVSLADGNTKPRPVDKKSSDSAQSEANALGTMTLDNDRNGVEAVDGAEDEESSLKMLKSQKSKRKMVE